MSVLIEPGVAASNGEAVVPDDITSDRFITIEPPTGTSTSHGVAPEDISSVAFIDISVPPTSSTSTANDVDLFVGRNILVSSGTAQASSEALVPTIPAEVPDLPETALQGNQPVEFVEESEYGVTVPSPKMEQVGYVTLYETIQSTDEREYAVTADGGVVSTSYDNIKYAEDISVQVEYVPQDLDFLKYFLGSEFEPDDSGNSVQFGEWSGGQFRRITGCVGERFNLQIPQDEVAIVSCQLFGADKTEWSDSYYTNQPSIEREGDPLSFDDLANIEIDYEPISDYVEGVELDINNSYNTMKSPQSPFDTLLHLLMIEKRDITLTFEIAQVDNEIANIVSEYDEHTVSFDIRDYHFEFSGVRFREHTQMNRVDLRRWPLTTEPIKHVEITEVD